MKKLFNILPWALVIIIVFFRAPSWIDAFNREGGMAPVVTILNLKLPPSDQKPSVLVFWATWCAPCTLELSRLQKAINEKKIDASRVFAISIEEDEKIVLKTAKERGYTFTTLLDHKGEAAKAYGIMATPTIILVTSDQKINWISSGISPTLVFRVESLF